MSSSISEEEKLSTAELQTRIEAIVRDELEWKAELIVGGTARLLPVKLGPVRVWSQFMANDGCTRKPLDCWQRLNNPRMYLTCTLPNPSPSSSSSSEPAAQTPTSESPVEVNLSANAAEVIRFRISFLTPGDKGPTKGKKRRVWKTLMEHAVSCGAIATAERTENWVGHARERRKSCAFGMWKDVMYNFQQQQQPCTEEEEGGAEQRSSDVWDVLSVRTHCSLWAVARHL
jgi:hypothetical protein